MKLLIHPRVDFASQSRGPEILGISTSFLILAGLIVALRFYTKVRIVGIVNADDWIILAALLPITGTTVCIWQEVHYGLGRHIQTLTDAELALNFEWFFFSMPTYATSIALTKSSILVAYLRFFKQQPKTLLASRIILAFVVLYWLWSFIFQFVACRPLQYFWDKSLSGHCRNQEPDWFTYSAYNMVSDLIILVIPVRALYSLSIPRKLKLWLISAFALGGLVFIISMVRIITLNNLLKSTDPTWENAGAAYMSCIEADVAIICASIPPLRALFVLYFPEQFSEVVQTDVSLRIPTLLKEQAPPQNEDSTGEISPSTIGPTSAVT